MLEVWIISYPWGQTMAPVDILDGIEDDEVNIGSTRQSRDLKVV